MLGRNFRCRAEILDAAAACVAHNERRLPKALIAMRGAGGEVRVIAYGSDRHEADCVAAAIAQALAGGQPAGRGARAGPDRVCQPSPCRRRSRGPGSRTACSASLGLYERSEVRDALAYLTLLANPADAQAFRRAVGSPRRGVGTTTANRVVALARETHHGDLIAASSPRQRGSRASARPRFATGSPGSARASSASVASCMPAVRSVTSSSPR